MAKKIYKTYNLRSLTLFLKNDEGKREEIVFRGGLSFDSTAIFSTTLPALQDMLEKCSGFNRDYYLASVVENSEPQAAPAPVEEKVDNELVGMKDSRRFRNLVEMKNAMREAGLKVEDGWNYNTAKAAAHKAGYDYQIQR